MARHVQACFSVFSREAGGEERKRVATLLCCVHEICARLHTCALIHHCWREPAAADAGNRKVYIARRESNLDVRRALM